MPRRLKNIKNVSPLLLVASIIIVFQIAILLTGWANSWWTKSNVDVGNSTAISLNEMNQQLETIENMPATEDKKIRMQKFVYQIIVGPISQLDSVKESSAWKQTKQLWQKINVGENPSKNFDAKLQDYQNEISKFNDFTIQNKLPTLSRVTGRMRAREIDVADSKLKENILFAFSKDYDFMLATVRTANIELEKKNVLFGKITDLLNANKELSTEIKTVTSEDMVLKNIWPLVKNILQQSKPALASASASNGTSYNGSFYALISLLMVSGILFAYLIFIENLNQKKQRNAWENNYLSMLNETLVKGNSYSLNQFNHTFKSAFTQIQSYVQKKMQYGQMFQETIPFPTILIDAELQVRWFNQSLIKEWSLEEFIKNRESLSWENFSQLTNMSASDPIIDVIKNLHAGIFKLQVKPIGHEKTVPYQMYVTPYQIGDEKLCLLFFYPLLTMEETIEMQTQSVIEPVKRTLEAMLEDRFDNSFANASKQDYEVGSISVLHDLFKDVAHKFSSSTNDLMSQLIEQENKVQDQQQIIQRIEFETEQMKLSQAEMKQSFQAVKDYIINVFEGVDNIQNENHIIGKNTQYLVGKLLKAQDDVEKLSLVSQSAHEQVAELSQLKSTGKEARETIQNYRSMSHKVVKAMSAFIDKQAVSNKNPLHNTWDSTVSEFAKIPDFFTSLDRYVQHMEIVTGKVILRLEESFKGCKGISPDNDAVPTIDFTKIFANFQEIETIKDELIQGMAHMYSSLQQQMKITYSNHENLYQVSNNPPDINQINDTNFPSSTLN